jgi:hemerythrin-like domain-containing protein
METATQILRKEHEAILKMLGIAGLVAQKLDRREAVAPETLSGLLEFFRLFADTCHHGKEEELLFPMLERKGLPRAGGPIGVMLWEHDKGRALIREMASATDAYRAGDTASGARWALAANGYADLLREHIMKENEILFVMAERMLSDAEQRELAAAFEKVEVEKMGVGTHERLHALMDQLAAEFAPASAVAR